jgi:hypothetical protein
MKVIIPENITPKEFIEEFLPSEYKKIKNELPLLPLNFILGVEILGRKGGDWSIEYEEGDVFVFKGTPDEPFFTFSVEYEEWEKALNLGIGEFFFDILAVDKDYAQKLISQKKIDKIKNEHGKFNITIEKIEINGVVVNFDFSILLGEPLERDPKVNIIINQNDFNLIKENYKNIYQLISKKSLNITGDFNYLMKIITTIFLGF